MSSDPVSPVDKCPIHPLGIAHRGPNRHRFIMAVGAKILVVTLGADIFGALRLEAVATEKTVSVGIHIFRLSCVEIETIVALATPSRIQVRFVTGDAIGMPQMLLFF